jgi:hypothetical protein
MSGGRFRRARPWPSAVDPDGYLHFPLPPAGSDTEATTDSVLALCDDWFVAEAEFVRRLMRKIAGPNREAVDHAAATTAFAYFQAVRNGNGMAQFIRNHLDGSEPIREAKGLFIRTVELHRRAALRERRYSRSLATHESPTAPEELPESTPQLQTSHHLPVALLQAHDALLDLARMSWPDAHAVQSQLDVLMSLCSPEVRHSGMLETLTDRQRFVFLLRADPLADVEGMALEYDQIAVLASAIGMPANAEALRQSLRAARQRLRITHRSVFDELRHG